MSYFPGDIPFMSKEELRENGIKIPKDATDTNVGDTISRQAAIMDVESWVAVDEYEKHLQKKVVEWLKEFPPAEPEIIECDPVKACNEATMNKLFSAYRYLSMLEDLKVYGYVLAKRRGVTE